ncbi:hypothetical protein PIB30_111359, partial [Stylosanthes scabra]|nr:hypothetical protein [Stylosanthes scabra]
MTELEFDESVPCLARHVVVSLTSSESCVVIHISSSFLPLIPSSCIDSFDRVDESFDFCSISSTMTGIEDSDHETNRE